MQYATKTYWNQRYSTEPEKFEWYQTYENLTETLKRCLQSYSRESLLYIGCGTSTLAMQLQSNWDKTIKDVTHLDFSQILIETQKREYEGQEFVLGDACELAKVLTQQYDIVLDKALMDTILCAENAVGKVSHLVKNVWEVLKPGGVYVLISYSKDRKNQLQDSGVEWKDITVERIPKPSKAFAHLPIDEDDNYHYVYVAQKAP